MIPEDWGDALFAEIGRTVLEWAEIAVLTGFTLLLLGLSLA